MQQQNHQSKQHFLQPQQTDSSHLFQDLRQYLLEVIPNHAFYHSEAKQLYDRFCQLYAGFASDTDMEENISQYCNLLVKNASDDIFFQHFIQNKVLSVMMAKLRLSKYSSSMVKVVFSSIEYLLKGLKTQEQYVYLLICISNEEYITQSYSFPQQEDWAYFANFLKLLVRSINQADKELQKKDQTQYLSIFFNKKVPQFPLILKLLKLYNFPDVILQTSVKLCFLELCKHPNKQFRKYMVNFPFILLYPAYLSKIGKNIKEILHEKDEFNQETLYEELIADLKFMEDFLTIREQNSTISMYANSYFNYVGRMLYQQLVKVIDNILNGNQPEQVKYGLKVLSMLEFMIKTNNIIKIRVGFQNMLHKYIHLDFLQYLKKKPIKLDSYWIFDECYGNVKEHSSSLFYSQGEKTPTKKSFIKTMKSYIPKSKPNWMFYQLKKISQIIGFHIQLNQQINHYEYMPQSYLSFINTIQQEKFNKSIITLREIEEQPLIAKHDNPNRLHSLFVNILKTDNQQIIYRYIILLSTLKDCSLQNYHHHYKNEQQICDLLFYAQKCTSLSLIASLYRYIKAQPIQIDDSNVKYLPKQGKQGQDVLSMYIGVMQKILHYILTQGWKSFIHRIQAIKQIIQEQMNYRKSLSNKPKFFNDVFRDIDCDVLYFIMLRHLFGTKNNQCSEVFKINEFKDIKFKHIKVDCRLNGQESDKIYVILDGQYIKFMSLDDLMVSRKPLSIKGFNICEDEKIIELVDKDAEGQTFTVFFQKKTTREFIGQEIRGRKQFVTEAELTLRTLGFPIE